jgi:hypothetical protein
MQCLVVFQRDSGERQEDITEPFLPGGGWLDAEIDSSFPASDPLSHWAGPRRRESEADRAHGPVVHGRSFENAPGRHPEEPNSGP